jgi:hypothetical protein
MGDQKSRVRRLRVAACGGRRRYWAARSSLMEEEVLLISLRAFRLGSSTAVTTGSGSGNFGVESAGSTIVELVLAAEIFAPSIKRRRSASLLGKAWTTSREDARRRRIALDSFFMVVDSLSRCATSLVVRPFVHGKRGDHFS